MGVNQPAPLENAVPVAAPSGDQGPGRWYRKALALLYVIFCFEIGAFLILFPWLTAWEQSYLAVLGPGWYGVWNSPFLRGAVSGLGLIDIAIGFSELFGLRRFSHPD